jgi:hypothetical protein
MTESVVIGLGLELGTWLLVLDGPRVGIESMEPKPQPDVTPDVLRELADKLAEYRVHPENFPPPLEQMELGTFWQSPVSPLDPAERRAMYDYSRRAGYRPVGRPRKYDSADVARVVVEAQASGVAITRAVARAFAVKTSYASVLIARARKEGFL